MDLLGELVFGPFELLARLPGSSFVPAILVVVWVRKRWRHLRDARRTLAAGGACAWLYYPIHDLRWNYIVEGDVEWRLDILFAAPIMWTATAVVIAACYGQNARSTWLRTHGRSQ